MANGDDRELERRVRVLERDMQRALGSIDFHVRECVSATDRADRFRRELRLYCVTILVGMATVMTMIWTSGVLHR